MREGFSLDVKTRPSRILSLGPCKCYDGNMPVRGGGKSRTGQGRGSAIYTGQAVMHLMTAWEVERMAKLPWLKLRKKTEAELPFEPPIFLGNKSNGEFFHAQTPAERKIRAEILRQCDDKARKLGLDRREFIASAMGM